MNFLEIDNSITLLLSKNIDTYKSSLKIYQQLVNFEKQNLGGKLLDDINKEIKRIEDLKFSENIYIHYKINSAELIKKYISILKIPTTNNPEEIKKLERKKQTIFNEYIDFIKTIIPYDIYKTLNICKNSAFNITCFYCEMCGNSTEFSNDGEITICLVCFSEQIKMAYYNNRQFILTTNKCNYDRISHFKECIKQFQGKQNTFINPKVYTDIKRALKLNRIIDDNEDFSLVKKSHIFYFLKELGYSKHYDDYILIFSTMTGKKTNDIEHLEEKLIKDFTLISEKYTQLNINSERKNFINIQFILLKLLNKYNYKYDEDDFINIKTSEKRAERDKICQTIFESLGWKYK